VSKVITPDGIELEVTRIGATTSNGVPMTLRGGPDANDLITRRTVNNCVLDLGTMGKRHNLILVIDSSLVYPPPSMSERGFVIMETELIFPPEHMHRPYWGTVNAVRSS
jgi:hypothetical protein